MDERNPNQNIGDQFRRYIATLKQHLFAGDERAPNPPGHHFIKMPTLEDEAAASEGERLATYMERVGERSASLLKLCRTLRGFTLDSPAIVWYETELPVVLARVAAAYDAEKPKGPRAMGKRRGRLPKDESNAKRMSLLAFVREHDSMKYDYPALALQVGISPDTAERWLKQENQAYDTSKVAGPPK